MCSGPQSHLDAHMEVTSLAWAALKSTAHNTTYRASYSSRGSMCIRNEIGRQSKCISTFIQVTVSFFYTSPAALWDVFQVASSEFRCSHLWRQAQRKALLDRWLLLFGGVLRHHCSLRLPLLSGCHRGLYLLPEQVPWKQQRASDCKCAFAAFSGVGLNLLLFWWLRLWRGLGDPSGPMPKVSLHSSVSMS